MMSLLTDLLNAGTLSSNKPSAHKGDVASAPTDFAETFDDIITSGAGCSFDPTQVAPHSSQAESTEIVNTEVEVEAGLDSVVDMLTSGFDSVGSDGPVEATESMALPNGFDDAPESEALTLSMINAGLKAKTTDGIDVKANAQAMTTIAHSGAATTGSLSALTANGDGALGKLESDLLDELSTRPERAPQADTARVVTDARIADRPVVGLNSLSTTSEVLAHRTTLTESINEPGPRERQPLAGDMATHIRVLKTQGGGEARLNLNPAELGRMSITVITESGETKVAFVVETASARHAVENTLPRLREMLEQAGLSLSDSEVAEGHRDAKSASDGRENSLAEGHSSNAHDVGDESLSISLTLDPERILDTFA
jgi:flagellar hook-length control protein FliK